MANVQVFLAVPFEVGAPDSFVQALQGFVESLLSGQQALGPANPVVEAPTTAPIIRTENPGDVTSIANSFLEKLGVSQPSPVQIAMVSAWIDCEKGGQPAQWNNPMNTTLRTAASIGSANSVGVQIYDTLDAGLDANIATLQQQNMTEIRQALLAGDAAAFKIGFEPGHSPWGTGADCVGSALGV